MHNFQNSAINLFIHLKRPLLDLITSGFTSRFNQAF